MSVSGQEAPRQGPPQIVVTGQGEVRVTPDQARVSIGVQARAVTAAAAAAENSRKQRAVIDAIRAKGVALELIATSAFAVQPEVVTDRAGQSAPRVTGYLVSNAVDVEVRRIEMVGQVIDAALGAGANQVRSLSYSVANADSARRAALAEAVERARGDADVVARAAGGVLGPLIELTTAEYSAPIGPVYLRANAMAMGAEAGVAVEPGLEVVRASVSVRWQFVATPK